MLLFDQLALELHLPELPKVDQNSSIPDWTVFLNILKDLNRIGFQLISQEVNMAVGKEKITKSSLSFKNVLLGPFEDGYYQLIEVVFMKKGLMN